MLHEIHRVATNLEIHNLNFQSRLNFEKEKLEEKMRSRKVKQRAQEEKQRSQDMEFLTKPFDHLIGDELNVVLRARADIMRKYYK